MNKPLYIFLAPVIGGCTTATIHRLNQSHGVEEPRNRMVRHDSDDGRLWRETINPVIENRCVVCHGCYDAPCQLNLSSPEGIDRGARSDPTVPGCRGYGRVACSRVPRSAERARPGA